MAADALAIRISHLECASERINKRVGVIEGDIRGLRGEVQEVGRKLDASFRWAIGIILVNSVSVMLAVLLHR